MNQQETEAIHELADKLRLAQADAASSPSDQRRERLREELVQGLKNLSPSDRRKYLEALLDRFPVAGQILKTAAAAAEAESFDQLTARFLAGAANLPSPERAELVARLATSGLARLDRETILLELAENLRQALGLTGPRQPSLARLVELVVFLVDVLCLLDQQALKTMRELAPSSPLARRKEDLRSAAARFLLGEIETLEPQLRMVRSLIAGLLASLQSGGRDFGKQYVAKFSPGAIESAVAAERSSAILGIGKNRKERCWEKYTSLAKELETADLVDHGLKQVLAAVAERQATGVLNSSGVSK